MQPVRICTVFGWIYLLLLLDGCSSTPNKSAPSATPERPTINARQTVVATAYDMLGAPYRYGGRSPRGFDCSGLVWYSFQRAGIEVPRTARQQMSAARRVASRSLRSGDLLFFRIGGRNSYHVGIYVGGGRFIHAPSSGRKVAVARLDDAYWRGRLLGSGNFY